MAKEAFPLALEPEKTLTFTWKDQKHVPKTSLTAREASNTAVVAYKVKTTAPKRYVVRPPQGIILPGEAASISLTMIPKDADALYTEAAASRGTQVKSDDKFMVQAAIIPNDVYEQLNKDDINTELQKLWQSLSESDKASSDKKQIKSQRLTTMFDFPSDFTPQNTSSPAKPPPLPSQTPNQSAPDTLFADLTALRKKYDDMVAYSVVLTGERDYLTSELEESKQKLARLTKNQAAASENNSNSTTTTIQQKKEDNAVGFSFVQVLVIALVAFILGRLFS